MHETSDRTSGTRAPDGQVPAAPDRQPSGRQEEIGKEQLVVDTLYARLDELRAATRTRLAGVRRGGPSGSPQNRSERDAFATLYEDRLAQLESVEERLTFGRLDLDDDTTRYVGRIGLSDEDHASILTDWRAPAAQAFYRATAAHPDGVRRRRHLVTRGRSVTGLEDEVLDLSSDAASQSSLSGEGALLAAMAAGRTSRMGDIVATIQAEQDAIIRSELAGALVVQGGPGTGKTAVALHRAAYLLYAHRRLLERSGVLLVGPSLSFLHYIDQVLPSLGETGVVSTTIAELLPGLVADGEESPEVARIKGRASWARIVQRAVRARQRVPAADQHLRIDGHDLVVRRSDVRDAIAKAHRSHKPHNLARVPFVREMLGRLADQYLAELGGPVAPEERAEVIDDLRRQREIRIALNLAWMPLTPERLIEDLFVKPHRLAEAAPDMSRADRAALARPKGSPWTPADVPLLDEAAELLGEDDQAARAQAKAEAADRAATLEYARQVLESSGAGGGIVGAEILADRFAGGGSRLTTAERAAQDRTWTYAHVVVDEAQELSAMAWRALVRRCPTRSMTIVGDVAQTSSLAGARSWASMLDPLLRDAWRQSTLTVNYRTPTQIADTAQRFAAASGLPTSSLTSARDVPGALVLAPVQDARAVGPEVVARVRAALAEFVGPDGAGRVAAVVPAGRVGEVREQLVEAHGSTPLLAGPAAALPGALSEALTVLSPTQSKGLEFDAVVLVEPAEILAGTSGASDLYVAMTRPTQRLVVVHAQPLPAGFADCAGSRSTGRARFPAGAARPVLRADRAASDHAVQASEGQDSFGARSNSEHHREVLRALFLENLHPLATSIFESAGIDVTVRSGAMDEAELIEALQGVNILGIRSKTNVTAHVLESAPDLVAIGAFCIGTNQIDLKAAAAHGVATFNAPFSNTRSVVEIALAEIIALTRRLTERDRALHDGIWDKSAEGAHEVRGRTLGIIGYGNIGTQLSVVAEALGMSVIFYDTAEKLALGNARRMDTLDELLETADVVTLHVDGRGGNAGLFGEKQLSRMRPGSVLLNLSRGFVVDTAALREAILSGHLSGAAIDVFPEEPKKRGDHFESDLRGLPNVILTPHIGGSTEEAQESIGQFVAGKLRDYLATGSTTLSVNMPGLALEQSTGVSRIAHLHRNTPGVLAAVNAVLAEHGTNIEGQMLATRGELGYVVTDVGSELEPAAIEALRAMDATVKLRVLS